MYITFFISNDGTADIPSASHAQSICGTMRIVMIICKPLMVHENACAINHMFTYLFPGFVAILIT